LPVQDVDIATTLVPDETMRRLSAAGIRAIPTGIDHGTITAVVDSKNFEVTTLRRDTATDGRHAVVAFTTDWREDAARRDFTINALYAAHDGEIFDFHYGLTDLPAGRIRFIGDASARIREDYLRILRLFRFHAWYGKGDIAKDALNAVSAEKAGLAKLSGERIQQEFFRLLEAESPVPVLRTMAATGILTEILPSELDIVRLERLCAIDAANFFARDSVLRLAALLSGHGAAAIAVADRFKLSNKDRARLDDLVTNTDKIVSYLSIREVRKSLYRLGCGRFKDRVFLRWAQDPKPSNAIQWRALLALADAWERPGFPLTGRDVMLAGVPEGPLVGQILAEVEEWWIDSDFTDDEFSLAERLKAVVQATAY
jgi:poly(A) polymerase